MAAIVSNVVTGNWNDTGSWSGAVIPVSGDTVTLANGAVITVPVGYTAVCGTSPTNDSGAVALQTNTTSGTGVLVVNGTFKWQGPVRSGASVWTVGAGGTLTYDASGAATPATALYTWQNPAALVISGSSGSRCTVNSVNGVQSGGWGASNNGWGQIQATFTDFTNQGAATTSGNLVNGKLASGNDFHLDDCTLTNCAQIQFTGPFVTAAGLASTAIFRLLRTKISSPANTTYTVQIYASIGSPISGGGVRLIQNCDIAGQVALSSSDGSGGPTATGFTVKHNVFRCRDLSTGTMSPTGLSGNASAAWDQNLTAMITCSTGTVQDPASVLGGGTYSNSYLMRLTTTAAIAGNMHPVYLDQRAGDIILSGYLFQLVNNDTQGDVVNMTREATVARAVKILNCIYLPNSIGLVAGSLLNQQGGVNQINTKITFNHNTVACGAALPSATIVWGVGCEGGAIWPAGTIPSIQSNIAWNSASGPGTLANTTSPSGSTVANGAVTTADYNGTYNVTGTIYGNPAAMFDTTPGAHDVTGDPRFVAPARSLLNFDQGYSGAPVATAWVTATPYSVGDLVSTSVVGFFGAATFNWRCVVAHTSGSTTKPGSGDSYPANWEPACLKTISDSVLAGTTYSGGTNSLVGELVAWVTAGFAPQNPVYRTAGHDGTTIGAVPFSGGSGRLALMGVG